MKLGRTLCDCGQRAVIKSSIDRMLICLACYEIEQHKQHMLKKNTVGHGVLGIEPFHIPHYLQMQLSAL